MPALAHRRMVALLWIRGYADPEQRGRLRVSVDGTPVQHRLVPAEGYADLLAVDAYPERDFLRFDLEIDETRPAGELGTSDYDPRLRGISFDAYGWRLL